MKIKSKRIFLLALFFFVPSFSYAEVTISEIMYDLSGSDTDREWIEVQNNGSESIDLSLFSLRENETNHKLEAVSGGSTIAGGGFAIIADVGSKFLTDNPQFSGLLFDSSFSLSNTGETLILRKDDADIDSVTYSSGVGAAGDGNALSREGNFFVARAPTPGNTNSSSGVISTGESQSGTTTSSSQTTTTTSSGGGNSAFNVKQQIYANAGVDRTVLVGAEVPFNGSALGLKKEPLEGGRYLWNFGDGATKEGKNVLHIFKQPGEYAVTLDVSSGEYSQGDLAIVIALPPELYIGEVVKGVDGYVEVINKAKSDVDISGFKIGNPENITSAFSFPKGTIIRAQKTVRFSNAVTNIALSELSLMPQLLYLNGTPVARSSETKPVSPPASSQISATTINPSAKIISSNTNVIQKLNEANAPDALAQASNFKVENENIAIDNSEKSKSSSTPYIIGLLALIGLTSGAVLFILRNKDPADEYEIVE